MLSFPSTKRKSTADSNTLSSSNVVDVLSSASTELQEDDGSFLLREGEQGAIIPFDNALLGTSECQYSPPAFEFVMLIVADHKMAMLGAALPKIW